MSVEIPSREEWEQMDESEREQFKQEQKQRLDSKIEEEYERLDDQAQQAFDALDAGAPDQNTHTVTLTGGQEVEVIDTLPGRLEKKAARARNESQDAAMSSVIEVMTHLIQTEGYDSAAVWEMYYEKYGSSALMENVLAVTEPYYQSQKQMAERRDAVGN